MTSGFLSLWSLLRFWFPLSLFLRISFAKIYLRYWIYCNLMPSIPQNLRLVIIIIRMADEKRAANLAPVRIPPALKQTVRIQFPIIEIYCAIEAQKNHLGRILDVKRRRSSRAIFRTETVGQFAGLFVARIDGFWVVFGIAMALIAGVQAVDRTVAKVFFRQTRSVCATQLVFVGTVGRSQQRPWNSRF